MSDFALVHHAQPVDLQAEMAPLAATLAEQGPVTVIQPNQYLALAWVETRAGLGHKLHQPPNSSEGAFCLGLFPTATNDWVRAAQGEAPAAERLRGPFVTIGWNGPHLTLTVDQVGHAPLFMASTPAGLLVAASHARTVLAHPDVNPALDWSFVGEMVAGRRTSLTSCGYRHVSVLPAGHVLEVSPSGQRSRRWWSWPDRIDRTDPRSNGPANCCAPPEPPWIAVSRQATIALASGSAADWTHRPCTACFMAPRQQVRPPRCSCTIPTWPVMSRPTRMR